MTAYRNLSSAAALLATTFALSACGGASRRDTKPSGSVTAPSLAKPRAGDPGPEPNAVVATVAGHAITKAMYAHAEERDSRRQELCERREQAPARPPAGLIQRDPPRPRHLCRQAERPQRTRGDLAGLLRLRGQANPSAAPENAGAGAGHNQAGTSQDPLQTGTGRVHQGLAPEMDRQNGLSGRLCGDALQAVQATNRRPSTQRRSLHSELIPTSA